LAYPEYTGSKEGRPITVMTSETRCEGVKEEYNRSVMKLIALYSVFDGEELLEGSVRQIRPHVDFVLCSVQTVSYAGEVYEGGADKAYELKRQGLVDEVVVYTPQPAERPQMDELRKRFGAMQKGYKSGFTHFFHMDCDEYYLSDQFKAARDHLDASDADGSVAYIQGYFKRPDWELDDVDRAFVPFIHRYREGLHCCGSNYPYLCDPTRTVNAKNIIVLPREMVLMHHYSWVRNDIGRKMRNCSTAGALDDSQILEDYERAEIGSNVRQLKRRLRQGKNLFNISVGAVPAVVQ